MIYYQDERLVVRDMRMDDALSLFEAEKALGYGDETNRFPGRVQDAADGKCVALAAVVDGVPAGYVCVYWNPDHGLFAGTGVPELHDFGVLSTHRRLGAGTRLMEAAEKVAAERCDRVWLAVGLHHWYGPAQRLYGKRGFIPDGSGVWYGDRVAEAYAPVSNDDDLNLYLVKELRRGAAPAPRSRD